MAIAKKSAKNDSKTDTKKFVTGAGGLASTRKRWKNGKLITIVIVLVAISGGLWVWQSRATSRAFLVTPQQMDGGVLRQRPDGAYQRNLNGATSELSTAATSAIDLSSINPQNQNLKNIYVNFVANSTATFELELKGIDSIDGQPAEYTLNTQQMNLEVGKTYQLGGRYSGTRQSTRFEFTIRPLGSPADSVGVLSVYGTD